MPVLALGNTEPPSDFQESAKLATEHAALKRHLSTTEEDKALLERQLQSTAAAAAAAEVKAKAAAAERELLERSLATERQDKAVLEGQLQETNRAAALAAEEAEAAAKAASRGKVVAKGLAELLRKEVTAKSSAAQNILNKWELDSYWTELKGSEDD